MKENQFDPHVRFVRRRNITHSYATLIYAFDYRLFYGMGGAVTVELEDRSISLEPSTFLVIPPGVGYRLHLQAASADFYLLNFDFDSVHTEAPPRPPLAKEFFSREEVISQFCIPPFETVFFLPGAYELEPLLREIERAEEMGAERARYVRSGLMKYLLCKAANLSDQRERGKESERIQAIKTYIEQNYSRPINNRSIASEMGYHPHYLNTCFLESEGITLHAYIETVRLRHAKELLTTTQNPICEIARVCGFAEASYFTKFFTRHVGMTPKQYRELSM